MNKINQINPFAKGLLWKQRVALLWVTMGGVGLSRYAPGTMGSILATVLYYLYAPFMALWMHAALLLFVLIVSLISIGYLQKQNDQFKDASWMVIDEGIGVWIALLGWDGSLEWLIAGLVLFRILDIAKPFPISYLDQKGHGPWYVMLDDILAGVIALCILNMILVLKVFL